MMLFINILFIFAVFPCFAESNTRTLYFGDDEEKQYLKVKFDTERMSFYQCDSQKSCDDEPIGSNEFLIEDLDQKRIELRKIMNEKRQGQAVYSLISALGVGSFVGLVPLYIIKKTSFIDPKQWPHYGIKLTAVSVGVAIGTGALSLLLLEFLLVNPAQSDFEALNRVDQSAENLADNSILHNVPDVSLLINDLQTILVDL